MAREIQIKAGLKDENEKKLEKVDETEGEREREKKTIEERSVRHLTRWTLPKEKNQLAFPEITRQQDLKVSESPAHTHITVITSSSHRDSTHGSHPLPQRKPTRRNVTVGQHYIEQQNLNVHNLAFITIHIITCSVFCFAVCCVVFLLTCVLLCYSVQCCGIRST